MEQIDKLQSQILEHKAYLHNTDFVVIRSQETGQGMPEEIKDTRKFARAEINRLESEIAEIEKQFNQ
jgi:adenosyl cobinamide kinase/adenosyl cobinamide phosphate guanylyltransferase